MRHGGQQRTIRLLPCADADDFDPEAGFAKDGDEWEGEDVGLVKVGECVMHPSRGGEPPFSVGRLLACDLV